MFITTRLMLGASMLTVLTAVVASGITGWQLLGSSTDVVEHSVEQQFQAIAAGRQTSISTRLDSHRDLLLSTANTRMTQEAVYALVRPFASYRYEVTAPDLQTLHEGMRQWYQEQYQPLYTQRTQERAPFERWVEQTRYEGLLLQYNYMRNNPNPADQLANLTDAQDATIYGQQHSRYQASFREISQRYGYHDLMLVDASSLDVIYSVSKGPAFASSLRDGPFANTALGELAQRLEANPSPGRFDVSPFSRFAGNFNAHVVFFGVPVYHPDYSPDKPLGFLIAELPAEGFTQIMTGNGHWKDIGLGETGDAYLVDDQGQLITEPRSMLTDPAAALTRLDLSAMPATTATQIKQHQALNGRFSVSSPAVENAVAGRSGLGRQRNLFGEEVLMSWEPLAIGDRTYALITEQSLTETHGAVASLRQEVLFTTGLVMLILGALAALASWLLTRVISGPLNELTQAIVHTARERDLSARLPERRMDEIGQMSRALNQLFGTFAELVAGIRSSAEATVVASDQSGAISRECREATQRQQVGLAALDQQSASMRVSLESISRLVSEASSQAAQADQDAERGNRSVNEVSVQIQQLSEEVADSCGSMRELSQAAGDIMSVIDTIEGIAEQTNLLALNAAIEAARAGEHGRGFAVVADEVRRLSRNTQDATGQIQSMLDRLRKTVTEASAGLQREQESAALCLDAAARAENLLVTIRGQVNGITQATQHIDQALQAENQRASAMGTALADIHHDAERTAAAMTELASTAQEQVAMAREGRDAAAVFRTL